MELRDFHVHTTFSDGNNSPEEMVLAAINQGMTAIGFSDHSYTDFDQTYCLAKEKIAEYRATVSELRKKHRDRITVLCGIEQDYFSKEPTGGYDYVIGSVHYLKVHDAYIPVDATADILLSATQKYFNGDIYALAEEYYKTVGDVVQKTGATIIGHFDLITKFNENGVLFDENHPRYINAWKKAVKELLKSDAVFEINTGAVSRGYRTVSYPSSDIRNYILEHSGSFILSSDSHSTDALCFGFENERSWID